MMGPGMPLDDGSEVDPTTVDPGLESPPEAGDLPTLGQVGDTMRRFNEYRAAALAEVAPRFLREDSDNPMARDPGALKNFFTFGQAGQNAAAYRNGYNSVLREKAEKKALELMKLDALEQKTSAAADMAAFQRQTRLWELDFRRRQAELDWLYKKYQIQRDQEGDQFHRETVPPVTPEQRALGFDRGVGYEPDPRFPNRDRPVPIPGVRPGTKGDPVAPDSPLGKADPSLAGGPVVGSAAANPADSVNPSEEWLARAERGELGSAALRRAQEIRAQRKQQRENEGKPLEGTDREMVSALMQMRGLIEQLFKDFSADERKKFVGQLRFPARTAGQWAGDNIPGASGLRDQRFQDFSALVGQIKKFATDVGGKNLTKFERDLVYQFLPTGNEPGGASEFELKAKRFYESSKEALENRLKAAQGRGTLEDEIQKSPDTLNTAPTPTGPKTRTLSSGKVIEVEE